MTDPVILASLISLLVISITKLAFRIVSRIKKSSCFGVDVEFTDDKDSGEDSGEDDVD